MTSSPGPSRRAPGSAAAPRPDLVDLEEAGRRLGRNAGQIRSLMRRARFPRPHYRFGTEAIWHWPHVIGWLEQRSRTGRRFSTYRLRAQEPLPVVELVTEAQIQERLSIPAPVLRVLRGSGRFPPPDYRWPNGDAWLWETARTWKLWWQAAPGAGLRLEHGGSSMVDGRTSSPDVLDGLDAIGERLQEIRRVLTESPEPTVPSTEHGTL